MTKPNRPTEMELRVANTLMNEIGSDPEYSDFIRAARAAVRAMRDPSEEMSNQDGLCHAIWIRMIDAASPSDPT